MRILKNIFPGEKIDKKRILAVLLLTMVISGIIGFIYEELFYYIDLGYLVKRGSTFGPWIPIYAWGSLFIIVLTYRFNKHPMLVLGLNVLVTGLTEYLSGYILDVVFHQRLWDYNVEIWNFGNINGYICLRSVTLFSLSSLFLVYFLVPRLIKASNNKTFNVVSIILGIIFFLDMILYQVIK